MMVGGGGGVAEFPIGQNFGLITKRKKIGGDGNMRQVHSFLTTLFFNFISSFDFLCCEQNYLLLSPFKPLSAVTEFFVRI